MSRSNGSFYLRSLDPERGAEVEAAAQELYAIAKRCLGRSSEQNWNILNMYVLPASGYLGKYRAILLGRLYWNFRWRSLPEVIAGCAGYVIKRRGQDHVVLTPAWLPMGCVLLKATSQAKFSQRKLQDRQPVWFSLFLAIGFLTAALGFIFCFFKVFPVETHHETVKEAQLRKYNAAIEKQLNDEIEADARDWDKKAEIAIEKAK